MKTNLYNTNLVSASPVHTISAIPPVILATTVFVSGQSETSFNRFCNPTASTSTKPCHSHWEITAWFIISNVEPHMSAWSCGTHQFLYSLFSPPKLALPAEASSWCTQALPQTFPVWIMHAACFPHPTVPAFIIWITMDKTSNCCWCLVQILTRILATPNDIFYGLPWSLQANLRILLRFCHRCCLHPGIHAA